MSEFFRKFSVMSAAWLGSPWLFVANVLLILVWLFSGPLFDFSDTWQLIVNTATTVITYLAVFLIQNTQNRDAKAMHLKLDEIISSIEGARNRFVHLENVSDEELQRLEPQFKALRERAKNSDEDAVRAMVDDLDELVEEAGEGVEPKSEGSDRKEG